MINTSEKPHTNESVDRNTFFRIFLWVPSSNSSSENPVIKLKYAGIKGNTQGDRNESNPAINAAEYVTVCVNMNMNLLLDWLKCYYKFKRLIRQTVWRPRGRP